MLIENCWVDLNIENISDISFVSSHRLYFILLISKINEFLKNEMKRWLLLTQTLMLHACSRFEIALSVFSKKKIKNDLMMSVVMKTLRLIIDIVSSNEFFFIFLNFWTFKTRNSFNDEFENVASRKKFDFRYRWTLKQHDVVMMSSNMINWIYFSQFLIHFMNNFSLIHNVFHRIFKRRIVIRTQFQLKNRLHILFRQRIRNAKSFVHEFFKIDVDFVI